MKPNELYEGLISWFGGWQDTGVGWTEGLALYEPKDIPDHPELFLKAEDVWSMTPVKLRGDQSTLGVARMLNPDALYCAMRWDYSVTSRAMLRSSLVECWPVTQPNRRIALRPVDWGPNEKTGRLIDVSFGALQAMGITTDDRVACRLVPWVEKVGNGLVTRD
jgi:hypothetical protein